MNHLIDIFYFFIFIINFHIFYMKIFFFIKIYMYELQDGRLTAGDQLLKVDGQSLVGITQEK